MGKGRIVARYPRAGESGGNSGNDGGQHPARKRKDNAIRPENHRGADQRRPSLPEKDGRTAWKKQPDLPERGRGDRRQNEYRYRKLFRKRRTFRVLDGGSRYGKHPFGGVYRPDGRKKKFQKRTVQRSRSGFREKTRFQLKRSEHEESGARKKAGAALLRAFF